MSERPLHIMAKAIRKLQTVRFIQSSYEDYVSQNDPIHYVYDDFISKLFYHTSLCRIYYGTTQKSSLGWAVDNFGFILTKSGIVQIWAT